MFRYVAMIWKARDDRLADKALDLETKLRVSAATAGFSAWLAVLESPGIRVLVADTSACFRVHRFCEQAGVALGEVFARRKEWDVDAAADEAYFGRFQTLEVLKSQGRCLASKYWGNFVSIVVDNGQMCGGGHARYLFNDPSGTLPCYFAECRGVRVVFSCLEDCRAMGVEFPVNWDFVRTRAVNSFLDTDISPLVGVSAVHRGECVRFDTDGNVVSRSAYWHPASFEGAKELLTDPAMAAGAMRSTVRSIVHSMASHHTSVLAQTSGGLDSSIVLGCLSSAPNRPEITCHTDYAPNAICDERRWARHAAMHGNHRHIEICRDPCFVDYARSPALAPSVEPPSFFTHSQRGPVDRALAEQYGSTAVFTGEGGDSVFCAGSYVYAADHSLRRHGLGRPTWRTALQVASRRDRTLWQVMSKALAREVFAARGAEARRQRQAFNRLVSADAKHQVKAKEQAPTWWNASGRLSHETVLRIGTLAFPPVFYDLSTTTGSAAPYLASPLCSQPVTEVCLRIPVDIHFDEGRTRGLARRAFADVVPAQILRRQWKDRPLLYFEDVIQRNLVFIRETLMDGHLVQRGVLDRTAVERAMSAGPTASAAVSGEILSHVDMELWIRGNVGGGARV